MKALRSILALGVLLVATLSLHGAAAGRFETKLAVGRQPIHVLNRLTFGARPGDVEEVRRVGVEAWIRRQLEPARGPESAALLTRLEGLSHLGMLTEEIAAAYTPPAVMAPVSRPLTQLVPIEQMAKLTSGTLDERRRILAALSGDVRRQVLAAIPRTMLEGLPDLQQEATRATEIENEVRRRQAMEAQRKLRPPLEELLTPEQTRDLQRGTEAEKTAVLRALDPETRTRVFRTLPSQTAPESFRREALRVMNPQQALVNDAIEARILRAAYSSRQLEEVLVDFWFNHFNVFIGKGTVRLLLPSYERDAIRPHVLGRFHDLLLAVARHPAMLFYLDNHQSQAPRDVVNALPAGVRRPGLNENYARELLELHTLGVDGGYTQDDVINVARAFTGWTIYEPGRYGEYYFNLTMHDRGEKVVLGHTLPARGGERDGLAVIEILARHPSTARFIARKLAQRFVADDPPPALVERVAATFRKTDGDLRAVMQTLLLSPEFLSEGAWQAKMKSPFEMVISALRAFDADVRDTTALAARLTQLGQPVYGKTDPSGYPNTGEAWVSAAGLLARMNFATALASGAIAGVTIDIPGATTGEPRTLAARVLGTDPPPDLLEVLAAPGGDTPPSTLAGALLGSPAFQRR